MAGMSDEDILNAQYGYYQAKLDKYVLYDAEGNWNKNVQDAAILDRTSGLNFAWSVTVTANHKDVIEEAKDPVPWEIGSEAAVNHWDGSENLLSEAEYITSVFYMGDDQLGKFFYKGHRFMIVTRYATVDELSNVNPELESSFDPSLLPVVIGVCGKINAVVMQTRSTIVIATSNKDTQDFSYAKMAAANLVMNLTAAEEAAGTEKYPFEVDPVGGADF